MMKTKLGMMMLLGILAVGCCRLPVCTKTVYLYRDTDVNAGRPCAVDIIYPKDVAERDKIVNEIGPGKWFTSDLYDRVHKEKVWMDSEVKMVPLITKDKNDPFVVIFAEFTTPDPSPARGREPYLWFSKDRRPKGKKTEYIAIHNGSLERLDGKPSGRR